METDSNVNEMEQQDWSWRYPKLEWPVKEITQRWAVIGKEQGLRCVTIYSFTEEEAEHKYIQLFGKESGYGFVISPETTYLEFTRLYFPPGMEPKPERPKEIEYDTWYQPHEVSEEYL